MKRLTATQAEALDEPVGKNFVEQRDKYCSYCDTLIEPEFWCREGGPCHLCGEYSFLYEREM